MYYIDIYTNIYYIYSTYIYYIYTNTYFNTFIYIYIKPFLAEYSQGCLKFRNNFTEDGLSECKQIRESPVLSFKFSGKFLGETELIKTNRRRI